MNLPPVPTDGKFRVLVVEDEEIVARLVLIHLSMAGFDCRLAFDGTAGWEAFQEINPHLVLTDITMPGMTGWDLSVMIRRQSSVPIIMLTGSDSEEDQMHGLKIGADDYIPKPFNPKILTARIIAHLRRVYRYDAPDEPEEHHLRPGWGKCDGCGYIGPQEKFEAIDNQKTRVVKCPNCQSHQITFSLG